MSFEEWQQCVYPNLMLRYLRGHVPEHERGGSFTSPDWSGGSIYPGPSPHAAREQCMKFGRRVSLLWSVLVNRPGEEFKDGWGKRAEDLQDIYETAVFLGYATPSEAHTLAAGSLALTSVPDADLTEEERWLSCWGEPDDPLYQEASKALRVLHACLIREVFDWPGIPMPDPCRLLRASAGLPAASPESEISMTFEEWQQCVYPNLMLRYLRGDVPESQRTNGFSGDWSGGTIHGGPSSYAAREQCVEFGHRVSLLWSLTENRPGEELEDVWGRKAAGLTDLLDTVWFLNCAATAARTLAAGSLALTHAGDDDDAGEEKGRGGGTGDPIGDAASAALRVLHACLIRQIFTWPGIPMPDTE